MKPSTPPAALRPRHRRAAHAAPPGDRRALRLLACALAAVALGACAIADTPAPAPLEPPPAFRHAPAASTAASTTAGGKLELPPADEWWQAFEDAELDALGRRAAAGNQDIRAAAARVAAARAILAAQRSRLYPNVGLSGGVARSDGGRNDSPATRYSLGADASWEVDLWGRVGRAVELSQADLAASVADEAAMRLSIQATLVQTYLQLRGVERRSILLDGSVAIAQRLLELSQVRYESGVVARADVLQAQTQLANVETQRSELRLGRAQLEHALGLLLGLAPAEFAIAPTAELPPTPALPSLLPAQVLARRPDIAAARHRVVAAAGLQVCAAAVVASATSSSGMSSNEA